jgi:uncharacterized protein with PQ loop repeat
MMPAVILPERAAWLQPERGHAQVHLNAAGVGARAASWAEKERTAERKSALKQLPLFCVALALWVAPGLLVMRIDLHAVEESIGTNPLRHAPTTTMVLAFVLAYIVATGLLIAATASRLTEGRPLYVRTCLLFIIAPAILLSLISTLMSSLAFFLSLLIWCFPALL